MHTFWGCFLPRCPLKDSKLPSCRLDRGFDKATDCWLLILANGDIKSRLRLELVLDNTDFRCDRAPEILDRSCWFRALTGEPRYDVFSARTYLYMSLMLVIHSCQDVLQGIFVSLKRYFQRLNVVLSHLIA